MCRYKIIILFVLSIFNRVGLSGIGPEESHIRSDGANQQDTIKEQIIYNGKIWRNLYYMVNKDQFLFSNEFLKGSVTMRGSTASNINLKYDIFKDELLTTVETGGLLQLNKEIVDSFSVSFQNTIYRFIRIKEDSTEGQKGYFNVLYKGKPALYLKYFKKIDKLSINGENERFYQVEKLYVAKGDKIFQITGKNDLFNIFKDQKELLKSYIKKNNLKISEKEPESFIPVIKYCESLSQ